ncbi:hypothetical protein [Chryseobacterium sp. ERMR1:04]|uniref:hypothetical protein n=1 Tax=Chryseobacterium sp. ERMR1:04 TaxID=1705393 RepID=UPI000AD46289|nr:hypothetical protein [Chryseobacterium sp. ERMR1:04]
MKNVVLIVASLLCSNLAWAQKYSSKTGQVSFEASVPLFEDISAKDNNNLVILNADTGEIASVSMVKNYKFTVKLMEEHFNENYAESAKYPKATFTGKLANFDKAKLTASPQKYYRELNFMGNSVIY